MSVDLIVAMSGEKRRFLDALDPNLQPTTNVYHFRVKSLILSKHALNGNLTSVRRGVDDDKQTSWTCAENWRKSFGFYQWPLQSVTVVLAKGSYSREGLFVYWTIKSWGFSRENSRTHCITSIPSCVEKLNKFEPKFVSSSIQVLY